MIWDRFELISNFEAIGIAIIRKVFIKKICTSSSFRVILGKINETNEYTSRIKVHQRSRVD